MLKNSYPRPQLVRENWENLNGTWKFAFDDQDVGVKERWFFKPAQYVCNIEVPFVYQSELSGIQDCTPHNIVWYYRQFALENVTGKTVILHFGAVDYIADIYINGQHTCHHVGGHTSFEIDITPYLADGALQSISVRAHDPAYDESIPRGKQFWEDKSRSVWYTNSTGFGRPFGLKRLSGSTLRMYVLLHCSMRAKFGWRLFYLNGHKEPSSRMPSHSRNKCYPADSCAQLTEKSNLRLI